MKNISFRSLVIDLLDSPDGIPEPTYIKLVEFAETNHPDTYADIWDATEGGDGNNGYCVYIDEDTAQELRKK